MTDPFEDYLHYLEVQQLQAEKEYKEAEEKRRQPEKIPVRWRLLECGLSVLSGTLTATEWLINGMLESWEQSGSSSQTRATKSSSYRSVSTEGKSVYTVGSGGKKPGSHSSGRHK
ncbi:MAG: hypothetical protein LLF76_07535 [Planctomycetaceae bacterium]|nr:hypothetical protein [Planctomycetaceae bacterium]